MSHAPHAERIIALLAAVPGLDDDEIAKRLGIDPRQTVNLICRRLSDRGVLTRTSGHAGKIANYLCDPSAFPEKKAPASLPSARSTVMPPGISLVPKALERALIVLPCSGTKRSGRASAGFGPPILESLPLRLSQELREARLQVSRKIHIEESLLLPAWERYDGGLYRTAHDALECLLRRDAHLVILSGGYGVVSAREPIGIYNAVLTLSWWPDRLLGRCLIAYAERHGLTSVRAFAAATSSYCHVLRSVRWQDAGVADALLLTPRPAPGGIAKSPKSLGEALIALNDGTLTTGWQSCYGLDLDVHAT